MSLSPHVSRVVLSIALLWVSTYAAQSSAQHYHDARYLIGGAALRVAPNHESGIQLLDMSQSRPIVSSLFQPAGHSRFVMDADNRHLLIAANVSLNPITGPSSGCFRVDLATGVYSTVIQGPPTHYYRSIHIDYNGDYLACEYDANASTRLLRIDPGGGVTTLLSSLQLGTPMSFRTAKHADIDTGLLMLPYVQSRSPGWFHGVLLFDVETGAITTFAPPSVYSTDTDYYSQSVLSGDIEKVGRTEALGLFRGARFPRVLSTLHQLLDPNGGVGGFDLQTAATPLHMIVDDQLSPPRTVFYAFDARTWQRVATIPVPNRRWSVDFEFYRGRHTQTIRQRGRSWDILLSAPCFPGKPYAIAASLTGPRPGLILGDGRRVNLRVDPLTLATAGNRLPGIWKPGPGVLDTNGEAVAAIDLNAFPRLGIPLWIAWAVLDRTAPQGVAYLPDTYVLRI